MKYLIKKFWILILISIIIGVPTWVLCATRTNTYLVLKGDTSPFDSVVEIDTDNKEEGSFSTIYVISFDKSTIFQNLITKNNPQIESGTLSTDAMEITDMENYDSGKIQYYSSIETSLILAYTEASKENNSVSIDYKFKSFDVTYKTSGFDLKIGDKIIGVNGVGNESKDELYNAIHSSKLGDTFKVIRDDKELDIKIENYGSFSMYERYDIIKTTPSYKFKDNFIGGPSGGLLQTLSIYNRLTKDDLTHGLKIAGTGTISIDGTVGPIGGIREKVPTAFDDEIDVFFCVSANYNDALESYNAIYNKEKMKLIKIDTFYDCLKYLKEDYKNDFKNL